jgi:hypothetical protein
MKNKKALFFALSSLVLISLAIAKDVTDVQSIDASQRNQITVSSGGGGVANGASTATFNTFATSNFFSDRVAINTNVFENDTTEVLQIAPKPGQTSSYLKIVYAGLGSSALIRLSDVGVSGPFANITENTAGLFRITTAGTGATGGNIGSSGFDHILWDQTGHVTFGDAQAQSFNFIAGSVVKVAGITTFNGNVTNMVGTGLSNVVAYSQGMVTNRFTIP